MAIATELTINTAATALDMANAIFGPGVTVSSATYSGDPLASGIYSGALTTMPGVSPTDSGVILSTGRVTDFTNSSGTTDTNIAAGTGVDLASGINGDAALNTVAGMATFDGSILTAVFTPDGDYLTMQFVFSSEEYPEYINGGVNDAFGVWINGTFVPVTITVAGNIAIDEVNGTKNENLYRDNTTDQFNTEMDGFTYTLSLKAAVLKGQANTIKIGIADGGDAIYDSNLLIMADSVQTVTLAMDDKINVVANTTRTFDILANDTQTGGANLTVTQINGTNVVAGQTITLTSGQQVRLNADGTVTVFANGTQGLENLSYTVTDGVNTDVGYITINTTASVTLDGIVSGTSGNDVIDTTYLGDPDGDRIDNNDATGVQGTTGNADVIYAGGGNDRVVAGAGNDIIDADSGDDTVFGGAGDDKVTLGSGNDSFGTFNADSAGNDTVYGDGGNDFIITGGENDIIYGGTGNDTVSGGIGSDTLYGGDGADWFNVTDDHDLDTIVGGEGGADSDYIGFGNWTTTDGVNVTFSGNEAGSYVFRAAAPADVASTGIFSEIEGVSGTDYSDTINAAAATTGKYLVSNGGADTITGGAGNDSIDGGSGNDALTGGAGNDSISGGTSNTELPPTYTTVTGASGSVSGTAGGTSFSYTSVSNEGDLTASDVPSMPNGYWVGNNDATEIHTHTMSRQVNGAELTFVNINPGESVTILLDGVAVNLNTLIASGAVSFGPGSSGASITGAGQLINSTANATLPATLTINIPFTTLGVQNSGTSGAGTVYDLKVDSNAVFLGETGGNDTITAGTGDDWVTAADGNDTVDLGTGNDTVLAGTGDDTVQGMAGNDLISGEDGNDSLFGWGDNDTIYGGAGADMVDGDDGADSLLGGDGNDILVGDAGNDTLSGDGGADQLYGGDNDDVLSGGLGNDSLSDGDTGNDQLFGDEGDDLLVSTTGRDSLYGGVGNDVLMANSSVDAVTLAGGTGDDTLHGSWGVPGQGDVLTGDAGNDALYGNSGNDSLYGGADNDFIDAGDDNDLVYGGDGNDTLDGALGNDTLDGGVGADRMQGGDGADVFQGTAGDTVVGGEGGTDNDTLVLSNVQSITYGGGNNESGTVTFTAASGGGSLTFSEIETLQIAGWVDGSAGDDVMAIGYTDAQGDIVDGADGLNDTIMGYAGNDSITAGAGNDVVYGGTGNDTVLGGAGDDIVHGDQGDDILFVQAGTDTVYGGADNDGLNMGDGAAGMVAYGGAGTGDYLGISTAAAANVTYTGSSAGTATAGSATISFSEIEVLYTTATDDVVDATLDSVGVTSYLFGGNDSFVGGSGNDWVTAGDGNDTVTGGLGNDSVVGGLGDDSLTGGDGNDTLFGQEGADALTGGAGVDYVYGQDAADTLYGGTGVDYLYGGNDADRIHGGAGDIVVGGEGVTSGTDNDVLVLNYADVASIAYGGGTNEAGTVTFTAASGGGTLTFSEMENVVFAGPVDGTAGADVMDIGYTDVNGDIVDGADGLNDTILGYAGNDTINAGMGNDLVYGGNDRDVIRAIAGDDTLYGDAGDDDLQSGTGNDVMNGGDGADLIHVTAAGGADTVMGGETNDAGFGDILSFGTADVDVVVNFSGNEAGTLTAQSGGGGTVQFSEIETIWTASGNDTINASAATSQVNVLAGAGNDFVTGGAGGDYLSTEIGNDQVFAGAGNDTVHADAGADQVYGGDANDQLYGGADNDYMQGDAGDDLVDGGTGDDFVRGDAGNDIVYGQSGNDSVYGGQGNDAVYAGDGNDEAYGGFGNDVVYGGTGNDNITGSGGDDTVYGDDGNDTVHGSDGSDTLYGGAGADTLLGEDDADTIYAEAGDYVDGGEVVTTGTDNDTLIVNNVLSVAFDSYNTENGIVTFVGGGTLNFYNIEHVFADGVEVFAPNFIVEGTAGGDLIDGAYVGDPQGDRIDALDNATGTNADTILAGAGNDTVLAADGDDTIWGDAGDDLVYGGVGNDRSETGTGNDTFDGGLGNDTAYGGSGDDSLIGADGNDELFGLEGNDSIDGGAGVDVVAGGAGDDLVYGGGDADHVYGDTGNDSLYGDAGNDTVSAGENADLVYGGDGDDWLDGGPDMAADTVHGDAGNDLITGFGGNDLLYGGLDADTIAGGTQDDTIDGGAGVDSLLGDAGNDSVSGGDGDDVLYGDNAALDATIPVFGGGTFGLFALNSTGADIQNWVAYINGTFTFDATADAVSVTVTDDDTAFEDNHPGLGSPVDGSAQQVLGAPVTITKILSYTGTTPNYGQVTFPAGTVIYAVAQSDIVNVTTGETGNAWLIQIGEDSTDRFLSYDIAVHDGDSISWTSDNDGAQSPGYANVAGLTYNALVQADGLPVGYDDTISGGLGNDAVYGGLGNDSLFGDAGADTLDGGAGDDTLYGGDGADSISGGAGNDYIEGWLGNDTLHAGSGNDYLDGGDGDDSLTGGDGDDMVAAGNGNDNVDAGAGNDTVHAGEGNDTVTGGTGNDLMIGEGGDDIFGLVNDFGNDTITGSETGETNGDSLNLTALTGNVTVDLTAVDPEAGTVLAAGSTATFTQIETIVLGGAIETLVLADGSGADTVKGFTAPTDNGDGSFTGVDQLNVAGLTDALGNPVNVNDVTVGNDGNGNAVLGFPNGESLTLIGVAPSAVNSPAALAAMGIPAETLDFIVEGTAGADYIDTGYTGDPEGDMIDANDNLTSNNDDLVQAGAGNDTVFTTDGNDTVQGEDGDDLLQTGLGNDVLYGGIGNDQFFTENGSDTVYGGDGNDSVYASFDGDLVYGGDGNDSLQGGGTAANGHDTIWGDAGNDTLLGGAGNDQLYGGADGDTFVVLGPIDTDTLQGGEAGLDLDRVDLSAQGVGVTIGFTGNEAGGISGAGPGQTTFSEIEAFILTAQNDVFDASATTNGTSVKAGDGADTLQGGAGNDTLLGETGNDSISSGAGDDFIEAGTGDDYVFAGTGNDTVLGGSGEDQIALASGDNRGEGGDGNDTLSAEGGDDTLYGGAHNDLIFGGAGNDLISGGDGNDIINAGDGVDTIDGGADADTFVIQNAMGTNTLTGGETGVDNDSIDLLNHTGSPAWVVYGANESGTITAAGSGTTSFSEIEALSLTQGDDWVDASITNQGVNVAGNGGNDSLTGGSGADTLAGGDGDDTFTLLNGFGNDSITGGETAETAGDTLSLDQATVDVVLNIGAGTLEDGTGAVAQFSQIETFVLGSGYDQVIGSAGNDVVDTGAGSDTVTGGAGNDSFALGAGDGVTDVVVFGDGDGADIIAQFEAPILNGDGTYTGQDVLDVGNLTDATGNPVDTNDVTVSDDGNGNAVLTFPNGETITLIGIDPATIDSPEALIAMGIPGAPDLIVDGTAGNDYMDPGFTDVHGDIVDGADGDADTIMGYDGNDTIVAGAGNDLVDGGAGVDLVYGGLGNDTVFGQSGNDTISGDDGDDVLDGGIGDDTLAGGSGADALIGAAGDDSLSGNAGNDTLAGGGGADTIHGGDNDDVIDGGTADDLIYGEDGADTLFGDAGNDTIDAGVGNDSIGAGDGNDSVLADLGDDTVYGDLGDDVLDGGDGNDLLNGGDGNDTAAGGIGNDTLTGGTGADVILGGGDRDYVYGGVGDAVDGGEGGDDYDTLDLTAYGHPATNVIYDTSNPENGTVEFLDANGDVVDTMTFTNIEKVIACFTPGTMILTDRGEVAVQDLAEGDAVLTRDNGFQTIRWVGRRDLSGADLAADARFNPVRIAKGALGNGLPERDVMVSPQHRMLVTGPRAELLFAEHEVLVAACHMVGMVGVERVQPHEGVSYLHILFDQHEIVRADGAWSESFQPGVQTLNGLGAEQRAEIFALFPALKDGTPFAAARLQLKSKEARVLLMA